MPDYATLQVVEFDYGMKNENPVDRAKFFRKSDPDKAIKITRDEVYIFNDFSRHGI